MGTKHVLRQLMQGFPILIVSNQPLISWLGREMRKLTIHIFQTDTTGLQQCLTQLLAHYFRLNISHGVIHFVPSVGPRNHPLTGRKLLQQPNEGFWLRIFLKQMLLGTK